MRTNDQLHTDLLTLLAPVTRDRYTYTGTAAKVTAVNPAGIDLHDGDVRTVATAPDGTAHHYMVLHVQPRTDEHRRFAGGTSQGTFGFRLTIASGSPRGARWATDQVTALLHRARLHPTTGLLVPYLDQLEVLPDQDADPPRWYVPQRWSTTVH